MEPLLFLGSKSPAVATLVELLRAQGCWSGAPRQRFDARVEASVKYFQETHLGPDGRFLVVDGVVGKNTWWALRHASGDAQRSRIEATVPAGVGPLRRRLLEVALHEHKKGVREEPDGSNRGPEIDKYLPDWELTSRSGPPWCCYFYSWVARQALGAYPLGAREGSCARARVRAAKRALWIPSTVRGDRPFPGDAFVLDHGRGLGHIGFVLRVSEDARQINTVEGNAGNRVKVGLRELSDRALVGFIDNVKEESSREFERGVIAAARLDREPTR